MGKKMMEILVIAIITELLIIYWLLSRLLATVTSNIVMMQLRDNKVPSYEEVIPILEMLKDEVLFRATWAVLLNKNGGEKHVAK